MSVTAQLTRNAVPVATPYQTSPVCQLSESLNGYILSTPYAAATERPAIELDAALCSRFLATFRVTKRIAIRSPITS
jgi:hypothetical protein